MAKANTLTAAFNKASRTSAENVRKTRKAHAEFRANIPVLREHLLEATLPADRSKLHINGGYGDLFVSLYLPVPGLRSKFAERRHQKLLDAGFEPTSTQDEALSEGAAARRYYFRKRVPGSVAINFTLVCLLKSDSKSCRIVKEDVPSTRTITRVVCV